MCVLFTVLVFLLLHLLLITALVSQLLTEAMQKVHKHLLCCSAQQEVAGSALSVMHMPAPAVTSDNRFIV